MSLPSYLNRRGNLPFAFIEKFVVVELQPPKGTMQVPGSLAMVGCTANTFTVHEALMFSLKALGIPFPNRSPPSRSKKSSTVGSPNQNDCLRVQLVSLLSHRSCAGISSEYLFGCHSQAIKEAQWPALLQRTKRSTSVA